MNSGTRWTNRVMRHVRLMLPNNLYDEWSIR